MTASLLRFLRARDGIAAVEFALALPFLLMLCLGSFELSRMILIHQKAEKIAYTVADIVAQSTTLTSAQMNQFLAAAAQIMQPFAFGESGMVFVSSVYKSDAASAPTIRWRHGGGGTLARASRIGNVNGAALLPGGLTLNAKDNVIVAEIYYRYRPVFAASLFEPRDVYKVSIFKPRLGALTTPPS